MAEPLRIALPKGRMSEESLEYLTARGVSSTAKVANDRRLIHLDQEKNLEFLLIRSKDVGTYVEQGAADLGIVGLDLLKEHDFQVFVPLSLPFGQCTLSVAYPEGAEDWHTKRNLKVASKYPRLTSRFFFENGHNIKIILLYGSIEIAPLTGISDVIVDLVSTGQTLKANKLKQSDTILESTAQLVVNPSAYVFKRAQINEIIEKLA